MKFPKLRATTIGIGHPIQDEGMRVNRYYPQPHLETFVFKGAYLAEESFGLLESRCPRLQEIHIKSISERTKPGIVVRFLENCKLLKSIGLC